jgi:hypothetical protein
MHRAAKFELIPWTVLLVDVGSGSPDPGEFIKVWRYSHPPAADRVAFALPYDPLGGGPIPQSVPAK